MTPFAPDTATQSETIEFSAVIPTYNRARLVGRAIQSALDQSFPPAEIIVVDDGSTDDTEAAIRRFGQAVRYVRQPNKGGAEARNRGVSEATKPWIAFLDSDDIWTQRHLEKIVSAMNATGSSAELYFDDMLVAESPDETWWDRGGFAIAADHVMVPDAAEWVMREYQPMMLQSTVCRRSTFLKEGGLWADLRNAHDTHFFLKIGIGRPACAVRWIGSKLTADAPGEERLTSTGQEERRYHNKTKAFRDILRKFPGLTRDQRRCLRMRIADAYWSLGRHAWKRGHVVRAGVYGIQALFAGPGATLALAGKALHSPEHTTQEKS